MIRNVIFWMNVVMPKVVVGLAIAAGLVGVGGHSHAASLTWDGDGATPPNPNGGSGTWDTNATANWWDGGTNVVWPALGGADDDAVFADTAGTVTISGGVTANDLTFNTAGYTIQSSTLTLNGTTPTITVGSGMATISSVVAGSAGLTKTGTGTLLLSGANTYSGTTTISQGTLNWSNNGSSTTPFTLGDGNTGVNNVALTYGSGITGSTRTFGDVTVANTGSAGSATINFNEGMSVHQRIRMDLTLNRDVTLVSNDAAYGNKGYVGLISGGGAGAGNDTITHDGGQLVIEAKAVATANTFSGNVRVKTGILNTQNYAHTGSFPTNQNLVIPDTSSVTVDSGAQWQLIWGGEAIDGLNGGGTVQMHGSTGSHTLTVGASGGNGSFSGVLQSAQLSLSKTGSGTQVLSGANTYSGATSVQNGILQLTSGTNRLPTGTTVTLGNSTNSGKVVLGIGSSAIAQTLAGLLTSGSGTANAVVGGNAANSTLTLNIAGSNTYGGALGGAGVNENNLALVKTGVGTLVLAGSSTYLGGTTVSQGTLTSAHATALSTGAITVGDGSTGSNNVRLQFNASGSTAGAVTVANTGSSGTATIAINNGAGAAFSMIFNRATTLAGLGGTPNNQLLTGSISGTGAGAGNDTVILDSGAGNWLTSYVTVGVASGNNTYTGNLHIDTGNLQIGSYAGLGVSGANANHAIPDTASVTIDAGSTLRFVWNGGGETIDALNGAGTIDRNTGDSLGNVAFSVGASNGSGSFSGAITSQISLIKTGTGTQTLSGANTYGGPTNVNAGTLLINGTNSGSGAFSVANLATLGGTGSLVGSVTVNSGGTLAPGASIESLDMGVLSMLGASTFALEINTSTIATDLANVTGNFSLDAANSVLLSLSDLGSNVALAPGTTFMFIDYSGTWNNNLFNLGGSNPLSDDEVFTFGANSYRISYNGVTDSTSDVVLQVVPEPSSFAMLVFGSVVMLLLGRKRS